MDIRNIARHIEINGVVQGVGFRPFIFQLAREHHLCGEVSNTAAGVKIHVEGSADRLDAFLKDIPLKHPPLAHIVRIETRDADLRECREFRIVASTAQNAKSTLISPDVSICGDCKREIFDPADRRFRYAFTNCTNCGPRYTIINDIPYDRPKTAMAGFTMCALCQAEYDDPMNRRFHAQPNACPTCGPRLMLLDPAKTPVGSIDPIKTAVRLLKEGRILAIKGLGGFHLAVDATLPEAVARLRLRKRREEKPLALMALDIEKVAAFAQVTPGTEALLTGIERPIVLLDQKAPNSIAPQVAPGNRYFGVMLPYTPLHYLLLAEGFTALVMTSANLSEEPIVIDNEEAFERLNGITDFFLIHNRDIYLRSDDSIVRHILGAPRFIRRSRGFVPIPVFLRCELPQVLAVGAELKNTICLTKHRNAFVSQHIGDLENPATEDFLRLTVRHLQRILDISPQAVACDLHPDYLSTRYAEEETGLPLVRVQHHHAHIAACMAENRADGPVIGLAFDGTGFGPDHTVWGGEVLIADYLQFQRVAHLATVPMPGSAMAIKEPWRMAVSHLCAAYKDFPLPSDLPLFGALGTEKTDTVATMAQRGINAPMTSSLGRLFDAVAALVGLRYRVAFEGQAAMMLEMIADMTVTDRYELVLGRGDPIEIQTAPMIAEVAQDVLKGIPPSTVSAKFHRALIDGFTKICLHVRQKNAINQVALSGGVFQNAILLQGLAEDLQRHHFEVLLHRSVPANDGGISLGQAMIAAHHLINGTKEMLQ